MSCKLYPNLQLGTQYLGVWAKIQLQQPPSFWSIGAICKSNLLDILMFKLKNQYQEPGTRLQQLLTTVSLGGYHN